MEVTELAIRDVYRVDPHPHVDARGCFYEAVRADALLTTTGRTFTPVQANHSVSRRHTLRGIHGVLIPPGQAKIVTCLRGRVRDVVVDLRLGSPTFGAHVMCELDAAAGTSLVIAEGLGHGFLALTDDTCVGYLCSTLFVPGTQFEIDPFDPDLDLPWGLTEPALMSAKDAQAPSLARAAREGLLPTYAECRKLYAG